ncbi:MAG: SUMF1/EgtB/PvdO family nonheme iron enzyme, partial [Bacteroidetes bacterium]|nr:SUMF1/EgtB/PvdO family nonheme iron enzyme [Bacteroidota bacterium]
MKNTLYLSTLFLLIFLIHGCESKGKSTPKGSKSTEPPLGMVWIPEGTFNMGSEGPQSRPDEAPVHAVKVDGFWIDQTEVTNAQFSEFVAATGYVTTAEKPVDWEEMKKQLPPGTPKPHDSL